MSTDEKRAILGQLVIDYQAAKDELQFRQTQLARIARALISIGEHLRDDPPELVTTNLGLASEEDGVLDLGRIREIAQQRHEAEKRVAELAERMKAHGITV
jgi:hypothetical protein